jgi:hypothetical protein
MLPEGSYIEIADRKKRLKSDLHARLYWYEERHRIIISSVSGIAETDIPTVLPEDVSDDDLGRAVCDHLLAFEPNTPDIRARKRADWPAFVASGAHSVSGFESHSWHVRVETVGVSIRVNASPLKSLHGEISVEGVAGPNHADLGAVIRRVIAGAVALREKGLL